MNTPHDPKEVLSVVNENNEIIGEATRKEIHEKGLIHREVVIYLINDKNEVLLQERKDCNLFDHSCAGHFPANQKYEEAAQREFFEELGISLSLENFQEIGVEKLRSEMPGMINNRFVKIFLVRKKIDNLKLDSGEVKKASYYNKNQIAELLKQSNKMTPSLSILLPKYIIPLIN